MLPTLFIVDNKIVHHCYVHLIQDQQYCSTLMRSMNNLVSTTLLSFVILQAQSFLACIMEHLEQIGVYGDRKK